MGSLPTICAWIFFFFLLELAWAVLVYVVMVAVFWCFNVLIHMEPNTRRDGNLEYAPINLNKIATYNRMACGLLFEKYTGEHHIKIN